MKVVAAVIVIMRVKFCNDAPIVFGEDSGPPCSGCSNLPGGRMDVTGTIAQLYSIRTLALHVRGRGGSGDGFEERAQDGDREPGMMPKDRVTISAKGLNLAYGKADEASPGSYRMESSDDPGDSADQAILRLREKIQKMEQEIKAIEQADMDASEKSRLLREKRNEMLTYQEQLMNALAEQQKNSGASLAAKGASVIARPDI